MTHKVFISYSAADKSFAGRIYAGLECVGVRCWMTGRDLPHEADFQTGTAEAMAAAELVLLVFSSSANVSRKVIKELSLLADKPLVAARIEDVLPAGEFKQLIPDIEFHDLSDDFDARLEPFCRHVKAVLQAESMAKPVPAGATGATTVRSKLPSPVWAALALAVIAALGVQGWRALGPGASFWVPDTASSEPTKAAPVPDRPAETTAPSVPVAADAPVETAAVVPDPPVPAAHAGVSERVETPKARVKPAPPKPTRDRDLAVVDPPRPQSAARRSAAWNPSFNCKYARTRAEHMICSDPDLAAADVELDRAYRAARSATPDKEMLNELQTEWRSSVRDTCPDVDCMMSAYEQRIDELRD